jgi:predicted dehydrogenase
MTKKVRVGVIGTSGWAENFYLANLKGYEGVELAAICGRNRASAEELAGKYNVARVYSDFHEMVSSGELDAAIVVTPEDLHYPMVMAALEAGLHVICEKPMAYTASEAQEMLAKAEAVGVKHMLTFTNRWLPHYQALKRLVDKGYIGQPFHAYLHWPTGWGRYQEDKYYWYYDAHRAHGALSELGAHIIDLARWYLGDVTRVTANLATFGKRLAPDSSLMANPTNDSAFLILEFANGAHASLHVSAANLNGAGLKHTGQITILHGLEGTLESCGDPWSDPPRFEITGFRQGMETAESLPIPEDLLGGTEVQDPFAVFQRLPAGPRHFIDAILNDTAISPNFHDGYQVQRVIEAALESAKSGCAVSLAKEQNTI